MVDSIIDPRYSNAARIVLAKTPADMSGCGVLFGIYADVRQLENVQPGSGVVTPQMSSLLLGNENTFCNTRFLFL